MTDFIKKFAWFIKFKDKKTHYSLQNALVEPKYDILYIFTIILLFNNKCLI